MNTDTVSTKTDANRPPAPVQVAVIDIGASSLRMQIAEIHHDHSVVRLESFEQAVSLGKDSFTKGRIEKSTIEDCVHVLLVYRAKLNEYGITDPRQIRVVATSGVKEASNRLAFQDRVFIATGFEIERFDEAELHRATFLGISPFIRKHPHVFDELTMVCEVGGGTTEFVLMERDHVVFAQTYRLGALRLRKTLESLDAPVAQSRHLMETRIRQSIQQLMENSQRAQPKNLLALGGEMRFAAHELAGQQQTEGLLEIQLDELNRFTNKIMEQSTDRLATRYHLSLPEADSLGPALLTNCMIAQELGVEHVYVANVNLRDGLVQEMAQGRKWSAEIQEQIEHSAVQVGRKYHFDENHCLHISHLASSLFDQTKELHQLDARYQGILQIAALLHETGKYISEQGYHKHSLYLIRHSEFFGIGSKDVQLVGLVARYHRRATPQPNHDGYSSLNREHRIAVAKLAAILRVAKALDASRTQRIREIECHVMPKQVKIILPSLTDISLEQLEVTRTCQLFEDIFGTKIVIATMDDHEH
ncbi:MAG: exopolyphosphatase [Mariniblastus sp.]|nr:exopolyphosphatase [Mariniblastus sp.]